MHEYLECDECGHVYDEHDSTGCELSECACPQRPTKADKRAARLRAGLTATYKPRPY